jgi:hypothetical protein
MRRFKNDMIAYSIPAYLNNHIACFWLLSLL